MDRTHLLAGPRPRLPVHVVHAEAGGGEGVGRAVDAAYGEAGGGQCLLDRLAVHTDCLNATLRTTCPGHGEVAFMPEDNSTLLFYIRCMQFPLRIFIPTTDPQRCSISHLPVQDSCGADCY